MPSSCPTTRNRLATASSPYLRQHADNPVHWQPWDDDARAHAKATDTPILLSIGYSACHWCHVMAHECFENAAIAESMNAHFVNIKLDREERPDIDHVYQLAHQALSGRGGGWPLTVFLDPQDLTPFYIGTYFPSTPRHGLPGFPEVLTRVRNHFDTHRDELRVQSGELRNWLQHAETGPAGAGIDSDVVAGTALRRISARFDPAWGGSRGAPKFPRAAELEWLLDQPEHDEAHKMAHLTLRRMAARGLQDHLGGGFFRYCVDANWTIPHFEKMLYDNAQLLPLYARVAADDDVDANLRDTARAAALGISDWLVREMTAPDGAFYSSLDADSEGEEGRFYLWNREQVREALGDNARSLAETAFGLDDEPNFEGQAWHLLRTVPIDDLAARSGVTPAVVAEELAQAQQRLLETRARRERPARDDKILTAWNALAIAGLARSARMQGDARYADMALHALAALRKSAWIDGELFANSAKSASRIPGFLDDHALVLDALLEVMQLAFDPRDLDWAIALADNLLAKFEDHDTGGFWFSTAQHATPLARGRTFTDDALPNGNGVAIRSLLRLGHLLGRTDYLDAAECALGAAAGILTSYPDACPTLLRALHEREHPRMQIVIRCSPEQEVAWRTVLHDGLRDAGKAASNDTADAFLIPAGLDDLPYMLAARNASGIEGTAWICEGLSCRAPITALRELADVLRSKKR